jgi:alkylation response protein AidB-like acyl-CoA dehydrogenase
VQLFFDEATEAFRLELTTWFKANAPTAQQTQPRSGSTADLPAWARDWQRRQFEAGWLVPGNPPEFGGRDASLLEQFVHREELAHLNIASSFNPQGLGIIAPSLLVFGTPEQKQRWAVPLLRGDISAALGMSEPEAGSDLGGLRTRAELRDGHFIINGQKVWTSGAHDADIMLVFVRTDPDAPKHKGLSCLIVPTDTPGVTRRPFGSIIGPDDLDFNEVYLDDVAVPEENLLGPQNGGWQVANGSLGHERAMMWLDIYAHQLSFLEVAAEALRRDPALLADDRVVDDYANAAIDSQALRLLGMRTLAKLRRGHSSNEQSILKLFGAEAVRRMHGQALDWLGPLALDDSVEVGTAEHLQLDAYRVSWIGHYLRTFAGTIAGGTSEIQRNIIAERVLGLPR